MKQILSKSNKDKGYQEINIKISIIFLESQTWWQLMGYKKNQKILSEKRDYKGIR